MNKLYANADNCGMNWKHMMLLPESLLLHYIALTECSGENAMLLWVIYYPHATLVKCFEL